VVKSGYRIEYGMLAGSVVVLDKALAAGKDELHDIKMRNNCRAHGIPEVVRIDHVR
jgi:hypothetical protein